MKAIEQGPFHGIKTHFINCSHWVGHQKQKLVLLVKYIPRREAQLVLDKHSISTNWEASTQGGFLDLSLAMYHGRSCKVRRFGANKTLLTYCTYSLSRICVEPLEELYYTVPGAKNNVLPLGALCFHNDLIQL